MTDAKNLDSHDDAQLERAMQMARELHESGASVGRSFSFYDEGKGYERAILDRGRIDVPDYWEMEGWATELNELLLADGGAPVLNHNDFFGLNFLVSKDGHVDLIDWEYAGMSDYANDFGTFCVCEQLSEEEMSRALHHYFGRTPPTPNGGTTWARSAWRAGAGTPWALLKEAEGEDVGEWSHIYYRYGKKYLKRALDLYKAAEQDR